jgi:hypothetical protein
MLTNNTQTDLEIEQVEMNNSETYYLQIDDDMQYFKKILKKILFLLKDELEVFTYNTFEYFLSDTDAQLEIYIHYRSWSNIDVYDNSVIKKVVIHIIDYNYLVQSINFYEDIIFGKEIYTEHDPQNNIQEVICIVRDMISGLF